MGVYPGLIQKAAAEGYVPYLGYERIRGGEGINPQSIIAAAEPILTSFSKPPVRFAYAAVGGVTPPLDELDRLQYNSRGDHQPFAEMFRSDPAIKALNSISRLTLDIGRRMDVALAGQELNHDMVPSQGLVAFSQGANAVVESCVGEGRISVPRGSVGIYGAYQSNELLSDANAQHYLTLLETLAESGSNVAMRGTMIDWGKREVPISFSRRPGENFTVCGDGGRDAQSVGIGGLLGRVAKIYDDMKDRPAANKATYLAFTVPQIALER